MALTPPLASVFTGRYPEFSSVGAGLLNAVLAEAPSYVDESWLSGDQQQAMMLYAAHVLAVEGEPARSNAVANGTAAASQSPALTGGVDSVKVGDVAIKYGSNNGGASSGAAGFDGADDAFASTVYGQRFLMLRDRSFATVLVA